MASPTAPAHSAAHARALTEIWSGLRRPQKELPAKFFYDHRGSELFEKITELPEYYPSRCERYILATWMPELIASFEPGTIVELGAGSGDKTRILLRALATLPGRRAYVPIDVSQEFLHRAARQLEVEFGRLDVIPVVGDLDHGWTLPEDLPQPRLIIFLGGTIGNFDTDEAVALLRRIATSLQPGDRYLMGIDLRKDPAVIEAAYNDAEGVTAEFNINMLHALNGAYGTTFDLEAFEHRAFYDSSKHRIEMHLVCRRPHRVTVPDHGTIEVEAGESIRTEISCKYDGDSVAALFQAAGLRVVEFRTDPSDRFGVVEGAPIA
ncbi:MAG: L-histidine N(alpha)-methyltransferase [Gemmatimonadetes bacterium]|nr:L-histidine N(alpha)-methyltransferase [Gemmatimonadota bacterium]